MTIWQTLLGDTNRTYLRSLEKKLALINGFEPKIKALDDQALAQKTTEFRQRLAKGEKMDDILPEAFAVVREASFRLLRQRHYDVQMLGGMALHEGKISEMRTGEGKTLVATLPAYLNALSGRGVHIVTVNDYLARRDAVWMGQIYAFLGLTVGVLNNQISYCYDAEASSKSDDLKRDEEGAYKIVYDYLRPTSRGEAYFADITYGTNNEFGFDYLKDNLVYEPAQMVQRSENGAPQYNFAIIDEVDSILIDEARTPLIISAPSGESENLYKTFADIAKQLVRDEDFTVDEKRKAISLTDQGITKAENLLGISDIYTEKGVKYVHHLETATRAKALFEKDKEYVIKDGEIVIVDEFTGRLQPGRRWSEGLHQAIEAKEGVDIKEETRTFATVTLQNYFRLYKKLAGMTGTANTSKEEFLKTYNLDVVAIPPNRESRRIDKTDLIFQTEKGKFQAITRRVKELQQKGQPVLVGTVSIEKNELLSAYFTQAGIRHEVLNAKNHEKEGEIIASAGHPGSVVIATNMAGRGVDIKLGGPLASAEEQEAIRALGGLCVIGTERHDARRIDNQLRGRSGRQGDPGETQFYLSLEDTLMRVFASDRVKSMMGRFGIPEDEPIINSLVSKAIENAQNKIEGLNFDMRKYLLEYDDVTNHQRQTIYERRRRILFGSEQAAKDFVAEALGRTGWTEEEVVSWQKTLVAREEKIGTEVFWQNVRRMILQVIDMYWVEHLEAIEYMRSSVRLRAYGQRDPLVEFKKEGLMMFKEMEASIYGTVLETLENLGAESAPAEIVELQEVKEGAETVTGGSRRNEVEENQGKDKIGRNDPCPCGSGKKYKKCHGK